MACRFPGAPDPAAFWRLLADGRSAVRDAPEGRWDLERLYDPTPGTPGKIYTRAGGFLDAVDGFDAPFFGIAPREAASLDPQHRLLLEVVWEGLESAGIAPRSLGGVRGGVFVGIGMDDYARRIARQGDAPAADPYAGTGNGFCFAAGRISHFLGLQGPSLALDTACSSSLTAVHLACQSLRTGEADLALAGGVNLLLAPDVTQSLCGLRALSPAGECRTFDASADGYVRGEGCGVVVLKRLAQALAAGDPVLAVIRGSAVGHDGTSSALTAPNGQAQRTVIEAALADAGLEPDQVQYVEAHGTGTVLGDPIEMGAIGAVYGRGRAVGRTAGQTEVQPLLVGSVKTNIGHLETAAGIAGLLKVVLALRQARIPAHRNLSRLNPHIDLQAIPARIPVALEDWPAGEGPRRAAVSAFGLSGTNAHVIVEEAPPAAPAPAGGDGDESGTPHLLCLSARSAPALRQQALSYARFLRADPGADVADVCFSAGAGRSHFAHRLAVVIRSAADGEAALAAFERGDDLQGRGATGAWDGAAPPRVAFLFTGQGSQYPGMGWALGQSQPVFREAIERCARILDPHLDRPLLASLAPDVDPARLAQTASTQPVLFALEYALCAQWRSWGVVPSAVLGHSLGEYVAACVAGVFSLEDALHLVVERGRLLQSLPADGAMLAVFASLEEIEAVLGDLDEPYRPDGVAVAAVNGPAEVVLSGRRPAIEAARAALQARRLRGRLLAVSHAFHSPCVDPVLDDFDGALARVTFRPPEVDFVSGLHGRMVEDEAGSPGYWRRQMRHAVRFADGVAALGREGYSTFLEVGPNPVLLAQAQRCLPGPDHLWLASLRRGKDDRTQLLETLARLYARGVDVDWQGVYRGSRRRKLSLPTYPFERRRHWLAEPGAESGRRPLALPGAGAHPLAGARLPSPLPQIQFHTEYRPETLPLVWEHRVYGRAVVSGPTLVSALVEAARQLRPGATVLLEHVTFHEAMVLTADAARQVQIVLDPRPAASDSGAGYGVTVHSRPGGTEGTEGTEGAEGAWTLHASGQLSFPARVRPVTPAPFAVGRPADRIGPDLTGADLYREVQTRVGFEFGRSYLWIDELWRTAGEATGRMRLPDPNEVEHARLQLHPGLHDCCYQVFGACSAPVMAGEVADAVIPVGIDRFLFYGPADGRLWCRATLWPGEATRKDMFAGDYTLVAESGQVVAEGSGLRLRCVTPAAMLRGIDAAPDAPLYVPEWRPDTAPAGSSPATGGDGVWVIRTAEPERGWALQRAGERRGLRCVVVAAADGLAGEERIAGLIWLAPAGEVAPVELCAGAARDLARLAAAGQDPPARAWLVTRGAAAVAPTLVVVPSQASLWGLGRVLALEHPELWGGLIDLDPAAAPGGPADSSAEAEAVLDAIGGAGREDQVALRNGERYGLRLTPLRPMANGAGAAVQADASYLITGGYGAIGLHVARWLVAAGARHLVLCGRSGPPAGAPAALDDLRRSGATVRVARTDVADGAAVAQLIAWCGTEAPLRGIFHAAGVRRDGVLLGTAGPAFDDVFGAKVRGSWHLHLEAQRLHQQGQPLDHFVLFSSGASLLGARGQGAYAAANAYQDALAHYRRARGLPATAIHWSLWSQGGMAGADVVARMAADGVEAISPEQGVGLLGRILAEDAVEVAVLPVDWERYVRRLGRHGPPPLLRDLVGAPAAGEATAGSIPPAADGLADRLTVALPAARYDLLLDQLRVELRQVLGLDPAQPIPPGTRFFDLGMDSLMAIDVKNRLQVRLGRSLPATLLLDCPNLEVLAQFLIDRVLFPPAAPAPTLAPAPGGGAGPSPGPAVGATVAGPIALAELSEEQAQAALLNELHRWERELHAADGPNDLTEGRS
jgi:acyl transferase domain-containing protein/acyl carrier protein